MAQSDRWVVIASGDRPLNEVAKDLADTGFTVDQVFDQIGSIVGSADDAVAERLRALPGVTDVSPELTIDIGPPDRPITW